MPYISQKLKDVESLEGWDSSLEQELTSFISGLHYFNEDQIEGVLNYCISRIIHETLGDDGWRYKKINRAMGVLECVKQEFYRRVAVPAEEMAIEKNGDIY